MKLSFKNFALFLLLSIYLVLGTSPTRLRKHDLVNINEVNSHIRVDLPYATADNFLKEPVYMQNKCFLRRHVARKLSKVQRELEKYGLGLKIWDGFRPMVAQARMYSINKKYVAPPTKDRARHPRGTAVDLTLVDRQGQELEMPSKFDEFSEKAHRSCTKCSPQAIKNRELLENVMVKHGFVPLASEWWHFDHHDWRARSVINADFDDL